MFRVSCDVGFAALCFVIVPCVCVCCLLLPVSLCVVYCCSFVVYSCVLCYLFGCLFVCCVMFVLLLVLCGVVALWSLMGCVVLCVCVGVCVFEFTFCSFVGCCSLLR